MLARRPMSKVRGKEIRKDKKLKAFGPCLTCGAVRPLYGSTRTGYPVYCSIKCDLDNRVRGYESRNRKRRPTGLQSVSSDS